MVPKAKLSITNNVLWIHDKIAEMRLDGKCSTEVFERVRYSPMSSQWKFTDRAAAEEFSSFLTTHANAVFITSCRIITLTKSVTVVWAIPKDQLAISWGAANNTMWLHDKIAKMRAVGKCSTTVWQEASISPISSQWKFTNLAAAEEFSSFLTTHDNAVFISSCDIDNL